MDGWNKSDVVNGFYAYRGTIKQLYMQEKTSHIPGFYFILQTELDCFYLLIYKNIWNWCLKHPEDRGPFATLEEAKAMCVVLNALKGADNHVE